MTLEQKRGHFGAQVKKAAQRRRKVLSPSVWAGRGVSEDGYETRGCFGQRLALPQAGETEEQTAES